jgi:sporulation-control protein
MFKKLLNKIGIGTASVNLVLEADRARVGEDLAGSILIAGGSSETRIDAVNVNLIMKTKQADSEHEHSVLRVPVVHGLVVAPEENLQFPLRFTLPALPQSSRYVTYTLHTELDIPGAVDKHDFDEFYVLPAQPVAVLQDALHHLGFTPKPDSGEMEGQFQKFEYRPTSGAYKGRLSELEVIFVLEEEGVRLYVELDHKFGFFGQEIESTPTVFIGYGHLNTVESAQAILADFLEQEIRSVNGGGA